MEEFCPFVPVLPWESAALEILLFSGALWSGDCSSFGLRESGPDAPRVGLSGPTCLQVRLSPICSVPAVPPTGSCSSSPCPYTLSYTDRIPWVNAWTPVFNTDVGASQIPSVWVSCGTPPQPATPYSLDLAKRPHLSRGSDL